LLPTGTFGTGFKIGLRYTTSREKSRRPAIRYSIFVIGYSVFAAPLRRADGQREEREDTKNAKKITKTSRSRHPRPCCGAASLRSDDEDFPDTPPKGGKAFFVFCRRPSQRESPGGRRG
jgi:hypothetical protein